MIIHKCIYSVSAHLGGCLNTLSFEMGFEDNIKIQLSRRDTCNLKLIVNLQVD